MFITVRSYIYFMMAIILGGGWGGGWGYVLPL